MAKISELPVIAPGDIDGTELLPAVKGNMTGQASLQALAQPTIDQVRDEGATQVAQAAAFASQAQAVYNAAAAMLNPHLSKAAGEAATAANQMFSYYGSDRVVLAVRTASGSQEVSGFGASAVDLTFSVPSTYPTLQQAFLAATTVRFSFNAKAIIYIEAGHQPASGILAVGGDHSNVFIRSADAEVVVFPAWTGDHFLYAHACAYAPILDCLVNGNSAGAGADVADRTLNRILIGCEFDRCGRAYVPDFRGVKNVLAIGCWMRRGGHLTAQVNDFSGAGTNGYRITHGASADTRSSNVDYLYKVTGSGNNGWSGYKYAAIGVDCAFVNGANMSMNNCAGRILDADNNSVIQLDRPQVLNCGGDVAFWCGNSEVTLGSAPSSGGGYGLDVTGGTFGTMIAVGAGGFCSTGYPYGRGLTGKIIDVSAGGTVVMDKPDLETSNGFISGVGSGVPGRGKVTLYKARIRCNGFFIDTYTGIDLHIEGLDLAPYAGGSLADRCFKLIHDSSVAILGITGYNSIIGVGGRIFSLDGSRVNLKSMLLGRATTAATGNREVDLQSGSEAIVIGCTTYADGTETAGAFTATDCNLLAFNTFNAGRVLRGA